MRLMFAGTPDFAAVSLATLLRRGHDVVLVLTQPDRPVGRGLKQAFSPVKEIATSRGIALHQGANLKDPALLEALRSCRADAMVVAAYGLILPVPMLAITRFGCLNVHASLLPRWRGAAPIQRALMEGDAETGVCIMQMDAGLDTGPVYRSERTPIAPGETFGSLHERLARLGADTLCTVLDELEMGLAQPRAQPAQGVTYAAKLDRAEAKIDWSRPAADIERQLRALDPVPGASSDYHGQALKLWRGVVRPAAGDEPPGTVVSAGPEGVEVRCLDANLRVAELQRAGGRRMGAAQFLRGFKLLPGEHFG